MTGLERRVALGAVRRATHALLAETDGLDLFSRLSDDDVTFGRMARGLLRLVVARDTGT